MACKCCASRAHLLRRLFWGVMICYRHHLRISAYTEQLQELKGSRWTLGQLRLKNTSVTVGAAYLHTGLGPTGANLSLLSELGLAIMTAGRPFIIGADWNMEPAELGRTGFLSMLGPQVVIMLGVTQTCTSGRRARLLDYFIVSSDLSSAICPVGLDLSSPWKPHSSVSLWLNTRPQSVTFLRHVAPREIPQALDDDSNALSWDTCVEQAGGFLRSGLVKYQAPLVVEQHLSRNPRAPLAVSLGTDFSVWALALEIHACSRAGIYGRTTLPYLGRGQHPNILKVPLLERRPLASDTGEGDVVWWAAVAARFWDLKSLLTQQPGSEQLYRTQGWLAERRVPNATSDLRVDVLEAIAWQCDLCGIAAKSPDEVHVMADLAQARSQRARSQAAALSASKWRAWVASSLEKGVGKAHKFTKGPAAQLCNEMIEAGVVHDSPEAIMDCKAGQWDKLWGRDRGQEAALFEKVQALLDPARQQLATWVLLMLEDLARAIRATPVNAGLGFDRLQPSMLRSLPQEGKLQLLLLLRRMEADMILPSQLMLNLVALLDKPDGSDRPISLMPMPYRLLVRMRRPFVDAWDASQAGPWDAAVRGSGALEAAFDSELSMEMDHFEGKTTAGGLFDMAECYDNIDLCILVDEAVETLPTAPPGACN